MVIEVKNIFFITLVFLYLNVSSQDLDIIASQKFDNQKFSNKHVSFINTTNHHLFHKYNPFFLILGSSMFVYQSVISPQLYAGCLYSPSCSAFSKDAIQEYGILKGVALSADRLTRCTPFIKFDLFYYSFNKNNKINDPVHIYHLDHK